MKRTPKKLSSAELAAHNEACEEARAAESTRWHTVLSSTAAAGRYDLARSLLGATNKSAPRICAILLGAPVTSAAGAVRDQADWFVHTQRKVSGEYAPPLKGAAAKMVSAYLRTISIH